MLKHLTKILIGTAIIGGAIIFLGETPLVSEELKFVKAYETLLFDTPSGDMEQGYYAKEINEQGDEQFYYRDKPADEFQFQASPIDKSIGKPAYFDTTGLKEAKIIGKATYIEFRDENRIYRERFSEEEYQKRASIPNYPTPKKSVLVPIIKGLPTSAAIAVDANASSSCTSCTSLTYNHTVTGANTLMVANTSNGGGSGGSANAIEGVSFNTVPFTKIGENVQVSARNRLEQWYLIAPAAGTYAVVASTTRTLVNYFFAGTTSFTGASQTSPVRGYATSSATTGTTAAVTLSSAVDDIVLDIACNGCYAMTASTTQTAQFKKATSCDAYCWTVAGSTKPGAASVTMSWTWSANEYWQIFASSLKPLVSEEVIKYYSTSTKTYVIE